MSSSKESSFKDNESNIESSKKRKRDIKKVIPSN
jgi:hypothetical protein